MDHPDGGDGDGGGAPPDGPPDSLPDGPAGRPAGPPASSVAEADSAVGCATVSESPIGNAGSKTVVWEMRNHMSYVTVRPVACGAPSKRSPRWLPQTDSDSDFSSEVHELIPSVIFGRFRTIINDDVYVFLVFPRRSQAQRFK
eukprot:4381780-Alexandrium_andersonii.AAC.1